MSWFTNFAGSSIGKKLFMSLTGLFLVVFLLTHLAGNLLLFEGPAAFNEYSKFMSTSPFIRILEVGLAAGFFIHILYAAILTWRNKSARPQGYAVKKASEASLSSRTMPLTGALVLVFLIVHLNSFTFKHRIREPENQDFYRTVVEAFQYGWDGYYWLAYVIAMGILAFHLNHGFQSAFQTLGLNHKKYTPLIKRLGTLIALAIPAGFASIPVYFYFFAPKI